MPGARPPDDEPEPAVVDEEPDDPGDEQDDDAPASRGEGSRTPHVDDVVDRVERHARRRDRIRSRRIFAAWIVLVSAASVGAGIAGWLLGAGGS